MAKKPLYSDTPVVPKKKIAGTNPVGAVSIGSPVPTSVPQKQPGLHGLDVVPHTFRTPGIKGSHGYGHVAKLKQGHHRLSGVPGAHKLGSKA